MSEIEKAIQKANSDPFGAGAMLKLLPSAEFFTISRSGSPGQMLVVEDEAGGWWVPLFTNKSLAEEAVPHHPDHPFLVGIQFMGILSAVRPPMGIVLNPHSDDLCHRIESDQVEFLRAHLPESGFE